MRCAQLRFALGPARTSRDLHRRTAHRPLLGLTHRETAYLMSHGERQPRREASLERQAERRRLENEVLTGKHPRLSLPLRRET